jgi:hypothetical protein
MSFGGQQSFGGAANPRQNPGNAGAWNNYQGYQGTQQPQQQNQVPGGYGSTTSSVTPTGVYTPQMTQQAVNQYRAYGAQQADPRLQQKQFDSPGRSLDAGTMAAAMPGITQAQFGGMQQAAQTPLQDMLANQQQLLSGQVGQQNEVAGQQQNLLGQYGQNIYQQQNLYPMLGMLGQML